MTLNSGAGTQDRTAAIVIGRNEGDRLVRCLDSLQGQVGRIVYVDSGSTDDSVAVAKRAGAAVVQLDMSLPFTAARARNEGFANLSGVSEPVYLQFIDGDCELQPGWTETATAFLDQNPNAGVACGRRRERFPEASVYNRLCDWEWDTPVGRAKACGGDAVMRSVAFTQVDGFDPNVIAGEEPELCVRLRGAGWQIWRLDAEMTLHDAAITRFGQWWQRSRRAGHAFAEGAAMHGAAPEHHWVGETRRAVVWGLGVPIAALALAVIHPLGGALVLAAWPAQIVRLALREGPYRREGWERAISMTLGKIPELQGVLDYWLGRLAGRRRGLIEYK